MNNLSSSQTAAVVAFLEQTLQNCAPCGDALTGPALVAALDPGAITPDLTRAYLKLRAASAS